MRVLLVGGDRHGRSVSVEDITRPVADGYRSADWFHLPDSGHVWSSSGVPRVAVSFAESEGFPTFQEISEAKVPMVPLDMHARLQDAWRVQLARMLAGSGD